MKGRVIALICGTYTVEIDGVFFNVRPKGIFRNYNIKPVVGDYVDLDDSYSVITKVYDRSNQLIRPKMSNIDHLLISISFKEPDFSYYLATKYLAYASINGVSASLVFTKVDMIDIKEANKIKKEFTDLGIKVYLVSNKTKAGIEEIRKDFAGQTLCLMGQSGVGKSSLINAIDEGYDREIGEFSVSRGRGKHQTREVIMLPYNGGYIVDTPGFSDLDIQICKEDLAIYFPGFKPLAIQCHFRNCLHEKEKNCQVLKAVEENKISKNIYEAYLKILEEVRGNWRNY